MTFDTLDDDKKQELPLLLLGDEQENMIDRYLERGTLYRLRHEGNTLCLCVVTDEGNGVWEIKNLAVLPSWQRRGLGRAMIEHVADAQKGFGRVLRVGTGAGTQNERFYLRCGFQRVGSIPHFFTTHYDHAIVEDGVLLDDMAIFERDL